jgi:1,4-alpha-glucan branching enzyme
LHAAADRMVEVAKKYPDAWGDYQRTLNQMARELYLAQSSDWAFIMRTGTSVEYAVQRTKEHLVAFNRLYDLIQAGGDIPMDELTALEARDNIFQDTDYRDFL